MPRHKKWRGILSTLRTFECLSVRLSVRPSAIEPALAQCWSNILTLIQHWFNVDFTLCVSWAITNWCDKPTTKPYSVHGFCWQCLYFIWHFLMPRHKKWRGIMFTLRTFECLSVRLSVRPSAVEHSCPLHNFDTVRDNFTKLGTNINHDQTTCRD